MSEEKPKKAVRRRRASDPNDPVKERARQLRFYFSEDTQASIISYQHATDVREKNKIYTTKIAPAFEKLVENLINIHKFTSLHDSYDDLKSDCINFLFETLGKWDPTRGTAAFSYFNVVAKHCLINRVKQKNLRLKRHVSIDDEVSLSQNEMRIVEENSLLPSQDITLDKRQSQAELVELFHEIRRSVQKENELLCINSIIEIYQNIDSLDFVHSKMGLLIYIREQTGLSSKQLATAMQGIKKLYRKIKGQDLCL